MIISLRNIINRAFWPIRQEDHIVKFVTESECGKMTVYNQLHWYSQFKNALSNVKKKVKQLKSLTSKVLEFI